MERAIAEMNGNRIAAEDRAHAKGAGGFAEDPVIETEDGGFGAGPRAKRPAKSSVRDGETIATAADHLESLETQPTKVGKPIVLPKLDIRTIKIRVVGDAPLIVHAWSEKAKRQMLNKQMMIATEGKEAKDPEADFQSSLYRLPDGGFGFPSIAFKSAAVTACTSLGKAITKVQARQSFHLIGDMVRIEGTPTMREDMVRVGMGVADIRYRGEFREWSCELVVRYNARVISDEQLINLFNVAGFAVGVGEWRPEKDGQFGLFHVA